MNIAGQSPTSDQGSLNPQPLVPFPERREPNPVMNPVIERRQFGNSHSELSEEARQLGLAIDQYKLVHRRRYITYEEMLNVIKSLGYRRENLS